MDGRSAVDGGVLVVTGASAVAETVSRVAAATGIAVEVRGDPPPRWDWRAAALVVVDVAELPALTGAGLPRRTGVIAVHTGDPSARELRGCLALGVERTVPATEIDAVLVEVFGSLRRTVSGGRVLAVIGACGGAGASVLSAALATTAVREGLPTVLLDVDSWGAGLDVVMGMEHVPGVRWPDLTAATGRLPPEALHRALPVAARAAGRVPVLTFDREQPDPVDPGVLDVVLGSLRAGGDTVVVDVPSTPCPAGDRAVELADLTVLIAPADVRSCFAAGRRTRHLLQLTGQLGLVVRGPSPGGLAADDLADTLGLPLLGRLRAQPRLDHDLEQGRPPGGERRSPLGRVCRDVLEVLAAGLPS